MAASPVSFISRGPDDRRESGQALHATALVHEASLKLAGSKAKTIQWNGRLPISAATTGAMRRTLIDHSRRMMAVRYGGDCLIALDAS